jgi:8-oxo-dGTP diphosphatase
LRGCFLEFKFNMTIKEEVDNLYGNRLRVRACGICMQDAKILLIHHTGVGKKGSLWAPPGGGLRFGESAEQSLIREYKEETGLDILVKEFLFVNEYMETPLHAIELFFRVEITGGTLSKGSDPEMSATTQIIQELRYWSMEDIARQDPLLFHSTLLNRQNISDLLNQAGFFSNAKPRI